MKQYHLKRDSFNKVMKSYTPFIAATLAGPIIMMLLLYPLLGDILGAGTVTTLVLLYFAYAIVRILIKINKARRDWFSYLIIWDENYITKKQHKTQDLTILMSEITRIVQVAGGVSIQTGDPQRFLFVSSELEEYPGFLGRLNAIHVIEVSTLPSMEVPSMYTITQHRKPAGVLKILLKWLLVTVIIIVIFIAFMSLLIYSLENNLL
ncbi:hypothetical protein [Paenibacillus gansuensis]|uniref:PH domain-containing protein n=1 Tax=Paenibacillus gansuensis TaxID=306542 RepID=A0ABW5PJR8_9BACL